MSHHSFHIEYGDDRKEEECEKVNKLDRNRSHSPVHNSLEFTFEKYECGLLFPVANTSRLSCKPVTLIMIWFAYDNKCLLMKIAMNTQLINLLSRQFYMPVEFIWFKMIPKHDSYRFFPT